MLRILSWAQVCDLFVPPGGRIKMNLEVPFVVLPTVLPPPVSGSTPRPGSGHNIAAHPAEENANWTAVA